MLVIDATPVHGRVRDGRIAGGRIGAEAADPHSDGATVAGHEADAWSARLTAEAAASAVEPAAEIGFGRSVQSSSERP